MYTFYPADQREITIYQYDFLSDNLVWCIVRCKGARWKWKTFFNFSNGWKFSLSSFKLNSCLYQCHVWKISLFGELKSCVCMLSETRNVDIHPWWNQVWFSHFMQIFLCYCYFIHCNCCQVITWNFDATINKGSFSAVNFSCSFLVYKMIHVSLFLVRRLQLENNNSVYR